MDVILCGSGDIGNFPVKALYLIHSPPGYCSYRAYCFHFFIHFRRSRPAGNISDISVHFFVRKHDSWSINPRSVKSALYSFEFHPGILHIARSGFCEPGSWNGLGGGWNRFHILYRAHDRSKSVGFEAAHDLCLGNLFNFALLLHPAANAQFCNAYLGRSNPHSDRILVLRTGSICSQSKILERLSPQSSRLTR